MFFLFYFKEKFAGPVAPRCYFVLPFKPCHVGIPWIALTEYPYARVSIIFKVFCIIFLYQISHHQHKGLSIRAQH